jgi:hypothetical protein
MKERMLMTGMEYSVLKEEMEEDQCGWSLSRNFCEDAVQCVWS